jgi:hypothetical protein
MAIDARGADCALTGAESTGEEAIYERCNERADAWRRRLATTALGALIASAAACSGSSLGEDEPNGARPPSVGEDGGEAAPALSNGETVTFLTTKLIDLDTFILRGNIPVPPGTFPRPDGLLPFTIHDYDGTPLETQTEIVSRYADEADGADVVEVLARVRADPALSIYSQAEYEVRQSPRPAPPAPGTPDLTDLATPLNLPANVAGLFADPTSIEIATYDCFGNKYVSHPLDGTGTFKLVRHGRVQSELSVYQTMLPVTPDAGPSGTLPHFFGVHAYVSTIRGDDLLGLDLRFNNGHSGNDDTTTDDDPLDKVYFQRIDVSVPSHWYVRQAFEDPMVGQETVSGSRRTVSLVNPNADGTMHVMRWLDQMHRRLMLSTSSLSEAARKYARDGAGQGFCVRGTDPDDGHEYWSWWNRGTARYFTQNYQLPHLDFLGLTKVRSKLNDTRDSLLQHLESGTGMGGYPIATGFLGWAHPYGSTYGGMTGGDEIFMYDGIRAAYAGSRAGTQYYKALLRMHTDRQPTAFYDVDGSPTSVEDWVVNGRYVPFQHYVVPNLASGDPFGLGDAPDFQVRFVQPNLVPTYEASLMKFDPHDYQHYIRYTRSAKALAWLTNDSLSKDELLMQAENYRLAFHGYDNNSSGSAQETGMKAAREFIDEHPGVGFKFGRGEAWGIDCTIAAYAFAEPSWRAKVLPWFKEVTQVVNDGQAACSGFIQANISPKNFNGLFRSRQQIEQSIIENMLQGLRETVFRNKDTAYSDLVRDILGDSLYSFISDMNFVPGVTKPPVMTAVGPLDVNLPVWCSFAQMPAGTWIGAEAYQDWCSFAWGYELTGDPEFLNFAALQAGGNVLQRIENSSNYALNLENKAALLALLQRQAGTL